MPKNKPWGRSAYQVSAGLMLVIAQLLTPALAQAAAPAAPASPAPVPAAGRASIAADFSQLPFIKNPTLSPNGEWIGGLFGVQGERKICIINLLDRNEKKTCVYVPDMTEAHSLEWVNDDNLLIHLTAQVQMGEKPWYVSRLIGLNRLTGKISRPLWERNGQNADTVLWKARDGSPTILMAAQSSIYLDAGFWPSVYRVNVETGVGVKILPEREEVMTWLSDGDGVVRMGYGYNDDTRKSRLLYRDNAQQTFRVVDRANDLKREELRDPLAFGSVPGSALVIHKDTLGFSGLYEVDMATGKDLSLVWAAPAGQYIEAVSVGDDGKSVLGIWLRGDRKEVVWRDPVLNEIYTAFASSVPDKRVSIESTSRDRQRMLVTIDRPDSPGALYFFDLANPKLQRIAYMSDRLKDAPLNPVKAITYKSRDGLEIEAILTTPKNSATKKPPVVVMPHGGPWAHDTLDYDYWAQFVASLGYVVIQPNFRGSTGYGKDFERKGEGQLGLAMQDDLNDALKWVGDQGLGDPKRACIVGASYGGYATLWGLARDPALWRCGISIAGVANLRREVNDMGNGNITAGAAEDAWKRMTPDFAAVSPINRVGAITAPLLLVHGKLDVTVPHTQSEAMAAKMKAAGKPVDFVSLPKADHYFTREADRLVLLQSIETFLKKYNPAD